MTEIIEKFIKSIMQITKDKKNLKRVVLVVVAVVVTLLFIRFFKKKTITEGFNISLNNSEDNTNLFKNIKIDGEDHYVAFMVTKFSNLYSDTETNEPLVWGSAEEAETIVLQLENTNMNDITFIYPVKNQTTGRSVPSELPDLKPLRIFIPYYKSNSVIQGLWLRRNEDGNYVKEDNPNFNTLNISDTFSLSSPLPDNISNTPKTKNEIEELNNFNETYDLETDPNLKYKMDYLEQYYEENFTNLDDILKELTADGDKKLTAEFNDNFNATLTQGTNYNPTEYLINNFKMDKIDDINFRITSIIENISDSPEFEEYKNHRVTTEGITEAQLIERAPQILQDYKNNSGQPQISIENIEKAKHIVDKYRRYFITFKKLPDKTKKIYSEYGFLPTVNTIYNTYLSNYNDYEKLSYAITYFIKIPTNESTNEEIILESNLTSQEPELEPESNNTNFTTKITGVELTELTSTQQTDLINKLKQQYATEFSINQNSITIELEAGSVVIKVSIDEAITSENIATDVNSATMAVIDSITTDNSSSPLTNATLNPTEVLSSSLSEDEWSGEAVTAPTEINLAPNIQQCSPGDLDAALQQYTQEVSCEGDYCTVPLRQYLQDMGVNVGSSGVLMSPEQEANFTSRLIAIQNKRLRDEQRENVSLLQRTESEEPSPPQVERTGSPKLKEHPIKSFIDRMSTVLENMVVGFLKIIKYIVTLQWLLDIYAKINKKNKITIRSSKDNKKIKTANGKNSALNLIQKPAPKFKRDKETPPEQPLSYQGVKTSNVSYYDYYYNNPESSVEKGSEYGWTFMPSDKWNVPQKRTPPCVADQKCNVCPSLGKGTPTNVYEYTQVGSMLPKFDYKEEH